MKPKRWSELVRLWLWDNAVTVFAALCVIFALVVYFVVGIWWLIKELFAEVSVEKRKNQESKDQEITINHLLVEEPDDETLQEAVNSLTAELKRRGVNLKL